jgi:hypothetical protein
MASKFRNTGQTCVCANRIYVQSGIYEAFASAIAARAAALRPGDGLAGPTDQGPLINAAALAKEQRGYEHARALEALKNRGASLTDLGKLRMERDALRAANPKDPDLAHYDRVIDNKGTHSPGVTVLAGTTPQPMEGGGYGTVVVPKGGGAGQLQPLAGAPNKVKEAEALVAGYEYKTLPGGKVLMPFRKGTNEMATQEEEDALAKAKILLQQNTKPGLK